MIKIIIGFLFSILKKKYEISNDTRVIIKVCPFLGAIIKKKTMTGRERKGSGSCKEQGRNIIIFRSHDTVYNLNGNKLIWI